MRLERVISGGQTGVDIAALKAARECGLKTGGYMPLGWRTLDGPKPEYKDLFGMLEAPWANYARRTYLNVQQSDATLCFAHTWSSPGEICTWKAIQKLGKPSLRVPVTTGWIEHPQEPKESRGFLEIVAFTPQDVATHLHKNNVRVLNVAGNSEQTAPGIEQVVYDFLVQVFRFKR